MLRQKNYQIHVKKIDHGTPEDVLIWYSKVREVIKQKTCEDAQAKFTMTELLLEGQGLRTFLQLKAAVTEKVLVGDEQAPMGVTKESYAMTISKSSSQLLKNMLLGTKLATYVKVYGSPVVWPSKHIPLG